MAITTANGEGIILVVPFATRFAFRFTTDVVKAMLPPRSIGVYVLISDQATVYVGRSDHCLRQRLTNHNHSRTATHVAWEITSTVDAAYHLEAYLYHRDDHELINKIHPAAPAQSGQVCPFCECNTSQAITRALQRLNRRQ